jgi:hypothetical protein
MEAYRIDRFGSVDGIELRSSGDPRPGRKEVMMRVRASSLNYRDLMVLKGSGRGPTKLTMAFAQFGSKCVIRRPCLASSRTVVRFSHFLPIAVADRPRRSCPVLSRPVLIQVPMCRPPMRAISRAARVSTQETRPYGHRSLPRR